MNLLVFIVDGHFDFSTVNFDLQNSILHGVELPFSGCARFRKNIIQYFFSRKGDFGQIISKVKGRFCVFAGDNCQNVKTTFAKVGIGIIEQQSILMFCSILKVFIVDVFFCGKLSNLLLGGLVKIHFHSTILMQGQDLERRV